MIPSMACDPFQRKLMLGGHCLFNILLQNINGGPKK